MNCRWYVFLCFVWIGGVVELSAQPSMPSCIVLGFSAGTQIAVGTISQVQLNGPRNVTVLIEQYLRSKGPVFNGDVVTVPLDWVGTATPNAITRGRTPMWFHITPDIGKRVALALYLEKRFVPVPPTLRCVVDLDANPAALAYIQQMVRVDELPPQQKIESMQQILTDRSRGELLRTLAIQYLTSPNIRDPKVRLSILEQFAPAASDTAAPKDQRMEALDFIKWAYDSFSKNSSVNDQILSFMADRMADPDPDIRSSAVQYAGPKLVGLAKQGLLYRIHFTDRQSVINSLQKDVATGKDDSMHARNILQALGGH